MKSLRNYLLIATLIISSVATAATKTQLNIHNDSPSKVSFSLVPDEKNNTGDVTPKLLSSHIDSDDEESFTFSTDSDGELYYRANIIVTDANGQRVPACNFIVSLDYKNDKQKALPLSFNNLSNRFHCEFDPDAEAGVTQLLVQQGPADTAGIKTKIRINNKTKSATLSFTQLINAYSTLDEDLTKLKLKPGKTAPLTLHTHQVLQQHGDLGTENEMQGLVFLVKSTTTGGTTLALCNVAVGYGFVTKQTSVSAATANFATEAPYVCRINDKASSLTLEITAR